MGSFNTTCFVSRQTIAPGDECYIAPIIQGAPHQHPWELCGNLLEGVYGDYGQFQLVDTALNRDNLLKFISRLKQDGLEVLGTNAFSIQGMLKGAPEMAEALTQGVIFNTSYPGTELNKSWEELSNIANEYCLFGYDHEERIVPLQFAVAHKVSFEHLAEVADTNFSTTLEASSVWQEVSAFERKVLKGLGSLGIQFSPQVYAPQDYNNVIGQAYATFVSCANAGAV